MSEYVDVKPADVRVGDEVKVDGLARRTSDDRSYEFAAVDWLATLRVYSRAFYFTYNEVEYAAIRSSITEARRKVEKVEEKKCRCVSGGWCSVHERNCACPCPRCTQGCSKPVIEPPKWEPKPGEWSCPWPRLCPECDEFGDKCRVYRANQGWSPDTRKGERRQGGKWELKVGAKVKLFGYDQDGIDHNGTVASISCDYRVHGFDGFRIQLPHKTANIHARNLDLVDQRKSDRRSKS